MMVLLAFVAVRYGPQGGIKDDWTDNSELVLTDPAVAGVAAIIRAKENRTAISIGKPFPGVFLWYFVNVLTPFYYLIVKVVSYRLKSE
jgi:hypothetical protein